MCHYLRFQKSDFTAKEVNSQRESPNMDHVPESDKNKLEDAGDARNEKQKHTEGKLFKQDQN